MSNKNIIYTLCLVFAGFFTSCQDNDLEEVKFPKELYAKEIYKSKIRMFIGKNEVFDDKLIEQFVKTNHFSNFEEHPERDYFNISLDNNFSDGLVFISADSVKLSKNSTFGYTVKKNNNQFLFYSQFLVINEYPYYSPKLIKHRGELIMMHNGNAWQEVIVAYGSYNSLNLCFLSYKQIGQSYGYAGLIMNEFNENYVSYLKATDTLAVQESMVKFE